MKLLIRIYLLTYAYLFYKINWSEKKYCGWIRKQGYQYWFTPRKYNMIIAYIILSPIWIPLAFLFTIFYSTKILKELINKKNGPFSSMEMEIKNNLEALDNF